MKSIDFFPKVDHVTGTNPCLQYFVILKWKYIIIIIIISIFGVVFIVAVGFLLVEVFCFEKGDCPGDDG